jgi:transcriptional regulator with XRE-family HTH domain
MVKAHLRNAEMEHWQAQIGEAIERVQKRSGLSLKEFADKVKRNERQVARWFKGQEHPQLAAIIAVPTLRQLLVIALAEVVGESVEITTAITIRRIA